MHLARWLLNAASADFRTYKALIMTAVFPLNVSSQHVASLNLKIIEGGNY